MAGQLPAGLKELLNDLEDYAPAVRAWWHWHLRVQGCCHGPWHSIHAGLPPANRCRMR